MKKSSNFSKSIITLIFAAAASLLISGCTKLNDGSVPPHKSFGYMVVTCSNCQVQYGMPDQYKSYVVTGTSQKYFFTYEGGYTLVSYITPLGETPDPNIQLTVYDTKEKVVYSGSINELKTSFWETHVVLPADL